MARGRRLAGRVVCLGLYTDTLGRVRPFARLWQDRYFRGDEFAFAEQETNLLASSAARRVTAYYRTVTLNGPFYGAMRREQAIRLPRQDGLGGDWLFVAALAYLGKVRTVGRVSLNRSIGSLEGCAQLRRLVRASGARYEKLARDRRTPRVQRHRQRPRLLGTRHAEKGGRSNRCGSRDRPLLRKGLARPAPRSPGTTQPRSRHPRDTPAPEELAPTAVAETRRASG